MNAPVAAPAARTFTQTIEALRFGTLSDELTDSLRDLVAAIATTGKSGAITLTLALKPGKGGQIAEFVKLSEAISEYLAANGARRNKAPEGWYATSRPKGAGRPA